MDLDERVAIVSAQEELLKFETFTAEDAWELGKIFVAEAMDQDIKIAISIRSMSGKRMFHYAAEGTNHGADAWLDRKFKTVQHFESSTLAYSLFLKRRGTTLAERGLDPTQFVACGGGFPVFVDGVGVVAAVMVSGLTDVEDHDILVRCIAKYLGVEDVPRYPIG